MSEPRIISNKCQCQKCGDIIESIYRHDFKYCKCGLIFTDGGKDYIRRGFKNLGDIIDLTVYEKPYKMPE
jgi:hypothetical protein